jgi:hypothetical protein
MRIHAKWGLVHRDPSKVAGVQVVPGSRLNAAPVPANMPQGRVLSRIIHRTG